MKPWLLFITHVAEQDLARLPEQDLPAVIRALDRLIQNPSSVDIRKLQGHSNEWRVGKWRVRFMFVASTHTIQILRVLPSKSAY